MLALFFKVWPFSCPLINIVLIIKFRNLKIRCIECFWLYGLLSFLCLVECLLILELLALFNNHNFSISGDQENAFLVVLIAGLNISEVNFTRIWRPSSDKTFRYRPGSVSLKFASAEQWEILATLAWSWAGGHGKCAWSPLWIWEAKPSVST